MNIAIISKGIVRGPSVKHNHNSDQESLEDAQWCGENLKILKSCFGEHQTESFLFSWNIANSVHLVKQNVYDNVILLKQLAFTDAHQILPNYPKNLEHWGLNCNKVALYGLFMGLQITLNFIDNIDSKYLEKFDYICVTRPDLRIAIHNTQEWLSNSIVMPAIETYPINDQFFITPYSQLIKLKNLTVKKLNDLFPQGHNSEEVLKLIFENEQLTWKFCNSFHQYQLRCITSSQRTR